MDVVEVPLERREGRENAQRVSADVIALLSTQSEKLMLFDTLQERLLERIQRLEDDRHSVGLTSGQ